MFRTVLSRLPRPYGMRETLYWIVKNVKGPPRLGQQRLRSIPTDSIRHEVTPRLSLGFVGDILPLRGTEASLDPSVAEFFAGIDYLVGNFEGTFVKRRPPYVFMGQWHDDAALRLLRSLAAPERTVLLCSNNHSLDYGHVAYHASIERLRAAGYVVVAREPPCQRLNYGVTVAAGSDWSNRRSESFVGLRAIAANPPPTTPFRILCPHWGYELEREPRPAQIADGDRWLGKWDLIVGHHSHTPQPIVARPSTDGDRIIAYSLGNFTFAHNLQHHRHGMVVRADIGPDRDGHWRVGRLRWSHVELVFTARRRATLTLGEAART